MEIVKVLLGIAVICLFGRMGYRVIRSAETHSPVQFGWAEACAMVGMLIAASWAEINWMIH